MFAGLGERPWFYFVHSLHGVPDDPDDVARHVRLRRPVNAAFRAATCSPCSSTPRSRRRAGWRCSATSSNGRAVASPRRPARVALPGDRPARRPRRPPPPGRLRAETVYGDDPVASPARVRRRRRAWIHVVDLDAARTGEPVNRAVVAAIAGRVAGVAGAGRRRRAHDRRRRGAGRRRRAPRRDGLGGRAPTRSSSAVAARRARRRRPRPPRRRARRARLDRGRAACTLTTRSAALPGRGGVRDHRHRARRHARRARPRRLAAAVGRTTTPVIASGGVGTLDDLRALGRDRRARRGHHRPGALRGRFTVGRAEALAEVGHGRRA